MSEFADVQPGDLILTGTPGGVGYRREPQLLLKDGDVVVVEVDGVGRIENRCVAEPAPAPVRGRPLGRSSTASRTAAANPSTSSSVVSHEHIHRTSPVRSSHT